MSHQAETCDFKHFFFFFNDTATTEIYTLSLHDALPISPGNNVYVGFMVWSNFTATKCRGKVRDRKSGSAGMPRPISYAVFCLKKKKTHIAFLKPYFDRDDRRQKSINASIQACETAGVAV